MAVGVVIRGARDFACGKHLCSEPGGEAVARAANCSQALCAENSAGTCLVPAPRPSPSESGAIAPSHVADIECVPDAARDR
jgi:hypothetical protein